MLSFFLIKIHHPLAVTPDVFHALDNCVLHFSPKKLSLEHHGFFLVSEQLLLFDFHFMVIKEEKLRLIMVEEGPEKGTFSEISYEHRFIL
jgi:hypothetical protein